MQTAMHTGLRELPPAPHRLLLAGSATQGVFCTHCGATIRLTCSCKKMSGHLITAWCLTYLHEAPYHFDDLVDL
jgi:hypothetical protein